MTPSYSGAEPIPGYLLIEVAQSEDGQRVRVDGRLAFGSALTPGKVTGNIDETGHLETTGGFSWTLMDQRTEYRHCGLRITPQRTSIAFSEGKAEYVEIAETESCDTFKFAGSLDFRIPLE